MKLTCTVVILAVVALTEAVTDRNLRAQFKNGQAMSTAVSVHTQWGAKEFFAKMKTNAASLGKTIKFKCRSDPSKKYEVTEEDFKPNGDTKPRRNAVIYNAHQAEALATYFSVDKLGSQVDSTTWGKIKGAFQGTDKVFIADTANNFGGVANDIVPAVLAGGGATASVGFPVIGMVLATKAAMDDTKMIEKLQTEAAAKGCQSRAGAKEECKAIACHIKLTNRDRNLNFVMLGANSALLGFAVGAAAGAAIAGGAVASLATFGAATPFVVGGGIAAIGLLNKLAMTYQSKKCGDLKALYEQAEFKALFEALGNYDEAEQAADKSYKQQPA